MRKKILLGLLLLILTFAFDVQASEPLECKYSLGHSSYKVTYVLKGNVRNLQTVIKINDRGTESEATDVYKEWFGFQIKAGDDCPTAIKTKDGNTLKLVDSNGKIVNGDKITIDPNTGEQKHEITNKKPDTTIDLSKPQNITNSCLDLKEKNCEKNEDFACVWVEDGNYCNVDELQYVMCGSSHDIPHQAPELVSLVFRMLKIAVPIILVILGMIGLVKALAVSKEDEMKKAQSSLIKKIIAAALVFLVVSIVQFVISLVADDADNTNITSCINCFLNNDCQSSLYYKTNIGGEYQCTKLSNGCRTKCDDYYAGKGCK